MEQVIRTVLAEYAKLPVDVETIGIDDDLYTLGLTSHATVNLMLGLEDAFGVEFPDSLLRRETFQSVTTIAEAVTPLTAGK